MMCQTEPTAIFYMIGSIVAGGLFYLLVAWIVDTIHPIERDSDEC